MPPPDPKQWIDEPNHARRMWGAYLNAGFNRASFARAMEAQYHAVYQWDLGVVVPTLPKVARAAKICRVSIDAIWFGRDFLTTDRSGGEAELDDSGIKQTLARLRASPDARRALAEHIASPAGRFDLLTGSYVSAFATAYDRVRTQPDMTHEGARAAAAIEAVNAAGIGHAIARGQTTAINYDDSLITIPAGGLIAVEAKTFASSGSSAAGTTIVPVPVLMYAAVPELGGDDSNGNGRGKRKR